jgi:hypothetical protein
MAWTGLLGLLAFTLGACGSDAPIRTVKYNLVSDYDYTSDYLQLAALPGPVWLQSRDSPYPGGDAAMGAALAEASRNLPPRLQTQFTADPAAAGQHQGRLVYTFYPAADIASASLCDDRYPIRHRPPGDRLEVIVAFCFDYYVVSSLAVSAPPVPPGDTVVIRQVAERVMTDLFPDVRRPDTQYPKRGM